MAIPKVPTQGKPYTVITADVKKTLFEEFITMNYRHLANINPVVTDALHKTTTGTFTFVEVGDIGDDGAEAALAVTTADNPNKIPIRFSASQRTARVTLTRLVIKHPALRVEQGYIRKFPVTSRTVDGVSFLVLGLKQSTVEPVEVKAKPEEDGNKNQSKSKTKPNDKAQDKAQETAAGQAEEKAE